MRRKPSAISAIRLVALVIYGSSLVQPALRPTILNVLNGSWLYGYDILVWGWLGIFALQFEWLGNPALLLALLAPNSKPAKWIATPILLACAITAGLTLGHIPDDPSDKIKAFGLGFYLWLAALTCAAVCPLLAEIVRRKEQEQYSSE